MWVTSVFYAGIIFLCFNFLDMGDPLHASPVALRDLPDPFRFLTPGREPSLSAWASANVRHGSYSPNSTGGCGRADDGQEFVFPSALVQSDLIRCTLDTSVFSSCSVVFQ